MADWLANVAMDTRRSVMVELAEDGATQTLRRGLEERVYGDIQQWLEEKGRDSIRMVIRVHLRKEKVTQYTSITKKKENGCPPLARVTVEHHITTGNAAPIMLRRRRQAVVENEIIDKEVDDMLQQGVIDEGQGAWGFPVVLVKKKDGALAVAAEDKAKTGFITRRGIFQFCRMPFGLCNAPSTFQRLMDCVLRGLTWVSCLVYLDDVIVFTKGSVARHVVELAVVLERLAEAGLSLKVSKCSFAATRMEYLGHELSPDGVRPLGRLVQAVQDFAVPSDADEVRRFVALAGYYRRFIRDFGARMTPLTRLLRKTMGMMDYGMGAMPMMPGADPTGGFMDQLQDDNKALVGLDAASFDMDLSAKTQNRNRGNYRCSKCGEPKKGHVCPLVPSNYKCNRCGLSKKSCTCSGEGSGLNEAPWNLVVVGADGGGDGRGYDYSGTGPQRAGASINYYRNLAPGAGVLTGAVIVTLVCSRVSSSSTKQSWATALPRPARD
ncbi:hypothetical protein ON010_g16465 [Phytophthora cinnamomi]|nr:hypothetical protein ON010_g16465 [Phytophthora cinnamomi]